MISFKTYDDQYHKLLDSGFSSPEASRLVDEMLVRDILQKKLWREPTEQEVLDQLDRI